MACSQVGKAIEHAKHNHHCGCGYGDPCHSYYGDDIDYVMAFGRGKVARGDF